MGGSVYSLFAGVTRIDSDSSIQGERSNQIRGLAAPAAAVTVLSGGTPVTALRC